jgi:hypothetical protein
MSVAEKLKIVNHVIPRLSRLISPFSITNAEKLLKFADKNLIKITGGFKGVKYNGESQKFIANF